jgi:hypothetical protein
MSLKPLAVLTALSFCCQIVFSIYYATTIVDQNSLFNLQQTELNRLTIKNQQLVIELSGLNSLSTFVKFSQTHLYTPINSSVSLY